MKDSFKSFLEFLGRASLFLIVINVAAATIPEQLEYNWWFLTGCIFSFIWMYLPIADDLFTLGERHE